MCVPLTARLDLRYLSPIGSKGTSWARESSNEEPLQGMAATQEASKTEESDISTPGDAPKEKSTAPDTDTAFDQLVLPDGHKEIVVSLISQYFQDRDSRKTENEEADIVRGKGKGLIILLHGAPGVGKTTTAGKLADTTPFFLVLPLYSRSNKAICLQRALPRCSTSHSSKSLAVSTLNQSISSSPITYIHNPGDLGATAEQVEAALERHFSLASRWGCVLLLDEADVFLAERSPQDFKRNSFVAGERNPTVEVTYRTTTDQNSFPESA